MDGAAVRSSLVGRIDRLDWPQIRADLNARGFATTPPLLNAGACRTLSALWEQGLFRSRIDMARHGFGQGEYRYFAGPLPPPVAALREAAYPHLAPLARVWAPAIGIDHDIPDTLAGMRALCRREGQSKPTPLLLRYGPGDYNCLHQDLYGAVVFPFQIAILLSRPGEDFDGGQFLLVEQPPRRQSRGHVVALDQGAAVIFATRTRPVAGTRGTYRVNLRHGVSTVTCGTRFCLGIIFHDAA